MISLARPHNLELLASGQDLDPHRRHQGHTTATSHFGKAAGLQEGARALRASTSGPWTSCHWIPPPSPSPHLLLPLCFCLGGESLWQPNCPAQDGSAKEPVPALIFPHIAISEIFKVQRHSVHIYVWLNIS